MRIEKGNGSEEESATELELCAICGEPRGDETPCPHCGME